jgi:hypothetical protein
MNEIKRGFLQDYHKNGEPKTEKERGFDFTLFAIACTIFVILLVVGIPLLIIYNT